MLQSNELSPAKSLPAGPTATSAARAAAASPPKVDAKKRSLAKLSPSARHVGAIAPLDMQVRPRATSTTALESILANSLVVQSPDRQTNVDGSDPTIAGAAMLDGSATEPASTQVDSTNEATIESTQVPSSNIEGEEAPRTALTDEELAKQAAEAAERERKANGSVRLVYQQYDELFPIAGGSTTQTAIDEVYCLSFVMPNCRLRLSRVADAERFAGEERGERGHFVDEDPAGTFHELEADQTYYIVVEQESAQLERDREATRERWAPELEQQHKQKLERDDGRGFESCSCLYGNPCVDEYGCRDWDARFAVARANGWKGF